MASFCPYYTVRIFCVHFRWHFCLIYLAVIFPCAKFNLVLLAICKLVWQTKRANIFTTKEIIFIRIQTTWDRWWSVRWVLCETWASELTTMTTWHHIAWSLFEIYAEKSDYHLSLFCSFGAFIIRISLSFFTIILSRCSVHKKRLEMYRIHSACSIYSKNSTYCFNLVSMDDKTETTASATTFLCSE